jgi:hypothetical protein
MDKCSIFPLNLLIAVLVVATVSQSLIRSQFLDGVRIIHVFLTSLKTGKRS